MSKEIRFDKTSDLSLLLDNIKIKCNELKEFSSIAQSKGELLLEQNKALKIEQIVQHMEVMEMALELQFIKLNKSTSKKTEPPKIKPQVSRVRSIKPVSPETEALAAMKANWIDLKVKMLDKMQGFVCNDEERKSYEKNLSQIWGGLTKEQKQEEMVNAKISLMSLTGGNSSDSSISISSDDEDYSSSSYSSLSDDSDDSVDYS